MKGSVSLTLKHTHVRIKGVYIAKILAIRITGSSPNFASRHREADFRGVVFSGDKFRGLYLKTTDYTHSHVCLYTCGRATVLVWLLQRHRGSNATQIFRHGSYKDIFKVSSARPHNLPNFH